MEGLKNERSNRWKGDNVTVHTIHQWMVANFGNPTKCEALDCEGKSEFYDWALKKGKEYKKNKNNFLRLCRSCHRKYDMTPEKKEKAIRNLIWYHQL
jgi:hypothetical protein